MHLAQELVIQEVLQRKQDPWQWGVQCLAVGSSQQQIEMMIEADPLTTTQEVAEELSVDHSMVIWHLKQIGKVKKLGKWVPHLSCGWLQIKKSSFWSVILILHNYNKPFLDQIMTCDKKWIYTRQQPAQWLDREGATKHFPKLNLNQKAVMVSGGLLPIWFTVAFWIPSKPLHLRHMLNN